MAATGVNGNVLNTAIDVAGFQGGDSDTCIIYTPARNGSSSLGYRVYGSMHTTKYLYMHAYLLVNALAISTLTSTDCYFISIHPVIVLA